MKKILANDGIDAQGKLMLEQAGFSVVTDKVAQENLAKAINENHYDAITVRSATKVRKDVIDACPALKLIGRGGVGMDNIDVAYAQSKGISVVNTPAASSHSVAELVFAHLFSIVRFLHEANRQLPLKGTTDFELLKKNYSGGIELSGKTIGIIGAGRIGKAVARIAFGIGMNVVVHTLEPQNEQVELTIAGTKLTIPLKIVTLDELLSTSDFITLHVPGGKIITKNEIAKMKKGVILINAARGGVIDEKDLVDALNAGQVAGAGLDVFENEPKPNQELLTHPKISVTPHIGAATKEAQERIGIELAEKIKESLK
jgi:D-3-phosphoglycerate dehydrogenase / 2-oxoglutarate reductase